ALFDLAEADDKQSVQLLNDWGNAVAEGIAQIQIIYDPDLILIGGGISSQGDRLIQYIEPHIQHYLPHGYGGARLQTTRTKNHAALYGALVE
nr:ROK family protein [Staphylococcus lugdunensis]